MAFQGCDPLVGEFQHRSKKSIVDRQLLDLLRHVLDHVAGVPRVSAHTDIVAGGCAAGRNLDKMSRMKQSGGSWGLDVDPVHDFAWIENFLDKNECREIVKIGKAAKLHAGGTGRDSDITERRKSKIAFLFPTVETAWLFEKVSGAIKQLNEQYFGFDLLNLGEGLQFTEYKSPSQFYDWHVDRGLGQSVRKLSITIQLTNPDAYQGGDLEMFASGDKIKAPREQGWFYAFPSWAEHRVTPVTSGTRHSLVAWVSGPKFR